MGNLDSWFRRADRSPPETEPRAEDRALVQGALSGRQQDFETLVERHQRMLYRFVLQQLGDESAADEIVQATFVQAYFNLAGFRGQAAFKTWLYGIALNLCRDRGRALSRRREVAVEAVAEEELAARSPALEDMLLGGTLERRLAALPERQRTVLSLRIWSDLAFKEIARLLGISENAAKVNYHYAIRRLQEWVQESSS
jgi:RNA polymerase sigma-70 factor, ECF subfamily